MNKNNQIIRDDYILIDHSLPYTTEIITRKMITWLPKTVENYIVLCIGTDRSTGDALGPLIGTYLEQRQLKKLSIYGTLHDPVHATNIESYIKYIYKIYKNPFVIAIDACLGQSSSVGCIICGKDAIKPGAALNKSLPKVGDVYLTGVVNISGFMEYIILQNTRLSVVLDIAKQITNIIQAIDTYLTYHQYVSHKEMNL